MVTPTSGGGGRSLPGVPRSSFTILDTAAALGREITPEGHLHGCPLCGECGHGSAKVFEKPPGSGLRWHCHRCKKGGRHRELYAAHVFGKECERAPGSAGFR